MPFPEISNSNSKVAAPLTSQAVLRSTWSGHVCQLQLAAPFRRAAALMAGCQTV
jgi:hypothetical protein